MDEKTKPRPARRGTANLRAAVEQSGKIGPPRPGMHTPSPQPDDDILGRILKAGRRGFKRGWNPDDPIGMDWETVQDLRRKGYFTHPLNPVFGYLTEVIDRSVYGLGDLALRIPNAAAHGGAALGGQAMEELGMGPGRRLERDILGLLEVTPAAGSSLRLPTPAKPMRTLRRPADRTVKSAIYPDDVVKTFDPPKVPQRDFVEDYPHGATFATKGRLATDIEGRPLREHTLIVGRRNRRRDFPLKPSQAKGVVRNVLKEDPKEWPAEYMQREYRPDKRNFGLTFYDDNGKPAMIATDQDLSYAQRARVLMHEIGHVLADLPDTKRSIEPLRGELVDIYHIGIKGELPKGKRISPVDNGYAPEKADGEYLAEAFRLYLANPNFMKSRFPETAAWIRAHVNADPYLGDRIQFNALGGTAIGVGGLRGLIEGGAEPGEEQY